MLAGETPSLLTSFWSLVLKNVFVLDISAKAIEKAKIRLGEKARLVTWIETDILEFYSSAHFDVWHDRAALHFLTKKEDTVRYIEIAGRFIKSNGYLITSTFSVDGPNKCSGLDVTQYSEDSIKKTFQKDFTPVKSFEEVHCTPFNTKQKFLFSVFKRK